MNGLFPIVICGSILVLAALAALVYLLLKPENSKSINTQSALTKEAQKPQTNHWQIWILYFVIALVLVIWTVAGALFFLAVVWLLRQNPGAEASFTLGTNEKKTARRIYTWLFFSSIITVPIFIATAANIDYRSTINEQILAALIPLIAHVPLLLGLTSKSVFVYRHTQQGILLIALRAGMASVVAMSVENYSGFALLLFFMGNGALWLIGSNVGWNQASNGKGWFVERNSEIFTAQEPQAPQTTQAVVVDENDKKLEQVLSAMSEKDRQIAKAKALQAFRSGIQGEVRKNAVNILSILGEVEKF